MGVVEVGVQQGEPTLLECGGEKGGERRVDTDKDLRLGVRAQGLWMGVVFGY